MERKGFRLAEKFPVKAVYCIAFIFTAVLAIGSARYTHSHPEDYSTETLIVSTDSVWKNLIILMIVLAVSVFFRVLLSRLEKEKCERLMEIMAAAETIIVGILLACWVFSSNVMPYWDQYQVYQDALDFMEGNYIDMTAYLDANPQQYGMIFLCEIIFTLVHNSSYKIIEYCNVICIMLIIYLGYRVVKRWFARPEICLYYLFGILTFFPLGLYSTFVYGDVFSLASGVTAVWAISEWNTGGKWRYIIIATAALCIGTMARKNTLIMVIAAVIVLLVIGLFRRRWQAFLFALLLAVLPLTGVEMVECSYEARSGQEIGGGIPAILYIAMGVTESDSAYGMYNGYNNHVYVDVAQRDEQLSNEIGMEYVKEQLEMFDENRMYALKFLVFKLLGQWNDAVFSSLSNTAHFDGEAQEVVWEVYYGEIRDFIESWMERYIFVLYFSAAVGMLYLMKKGQNIATAQGAVIFIGGFLFSILWEAKGRYVMPYVVMLIPYSAMGFEAMQDALKRRIERYSSKC